MVARIRFSSRGEKTVVFGEGQRFQPELADHSLPPDMYVRRLVAVEAVEVEPMRTRDILNSRHSRRYFDAHLLPYNKSGPQSTGSIVYF